MTRYIPSSVADLLSGELWGLSRPFLSDAVTRFLFPVCRGLDGNDYLAVEDDFSINVHPEADLGGIAAILQPWIDGGQLPPDTNTQLGALIESKRGQRLVVYDAFPQLFKDMSKTYEQMIAAGLLAQPPIP